MSTQEVPELIETWKIARAIGWTTDKTTNFLRNAGIAERIGKHRDNFVMREDLEATMPRIYRMVVEKHRAGELVTKRWRNVVRTPKSETDVHKTSKTA